MMPTMTGEAGMMNTYRRGADDEHTQDNNNHTTHPMPNTNAAAHLNDGKQKRAGPKCTMKGSLGCKFIHFLFFSI
jgi:hypothetical protein